MSTNRSLVAGIAAPRVLPSMARGNGEVFTRAWVAELILDLAGYTPDRDLASMTAVEPACGGGAFLAPMVRRLISSIEMNGRPASEAEGAISACDLLPANVARSRALVSSLLDACGYASHRHLANTWIRCSDYLAGDGCGPADFTVGNPPYVRQENVDSAKLALYRADYPTMVGRADLYVAFIERALRSLKPGGTLAFICADRWMRNQYGRKLRALIGAEYSLDIGLEMHDVDAFDQQVSAYPAVTVIRRKPQGQVVFAQAGKGFGPTQATQLRDWIGSPVRSPALQGGSFRAGTLPHWFKGEASWPTGSPERLRLVEWLNDRFETLESTETGTRIGIGVATGADRVFVTSDPPDVERDRLLPLAVTRDISDGRLNWSGNYLIDPWDEEGRLVRLSDYPKLSKYFGASRDVLVGRHVAAKRDEAWYRTIDKVDHSLTMRPKLLFPDMKMRAHPVHDEGGVYPHHNLYYVVSNSWDLRVLGGLLLSKVAELFVDVFSVRMRGGTLRFQAQYLRRIRVPDPSVICRADAAALTEAFSNRDVGSATEIACRLYGIDRIPA